MMGSFSIHLSVVVAAAATIIGLLIWVILLHRKLRKYRHLYEHLERRRRSDNEWYDQELQRARRPTLDAPAAPVPLKSTPQGYTALTWPVEEEVQQSSVRQPDEPTRATVLHPEEARDALVVAKTPEYSDDLARTVFRDWCRLGTRPKSNAAMDIAFLQYSRSQSSSEVGAPAQHVLRDTPQIAEFVRFSKAGTGPGDALVFPTPDAHFTPVMNYLFPSITASALDNPVLIADTRPVHVRRTSMNEWETYA